MDIIRVAAGFDETADYAPTGNWDFSVGEIEFANGIILGDITGGADNRITQRFDVNTSQTRWLTRTYQESEDLSGLLAANLFLFEIAYFPSGGAAGTSLMTAKGDGTIQFGGRATVDAKTLLLVAGTFEDKAVGFGSIATFETSKFFASTHTGETTAGAWYSARTSDDNDTMKTLTACLFDFDVNNQELPAEGDIRFLSGATTAFNGLTRGNAEVATTWIDVYGFWAMGMRGSVSSTPVNGINVKNVVTFKGGLHNHYSSSGNDPISMGKIMIPGNPPAGYLWNVFSFETSDLDFSGASDVTLKEVQMMHGGLFLKGDTINANPRYRDIYFKDRYQTIDAPKKRELSIRSVKGSVKIQDHDSMALWASNMVTI